MTLPELLLNALNRALEDSFLIDGWYKKAAVAAPSEEKDYCEISLSLSHVINPACSVDFSSYKTAADWRLALETQKNFVQPFVTGGEDFTLTVLQMRDFFDVLTKIAVDPLIGDKEPLLQKQIEEVTEEQASQAQAAAANEDQNPLAIVASSNKNAIVKAENWQFRWTLNNVSTAAATFFGRLFQVESHFPTALRMMADQLILQMRAMPAPMPQLGPAAAATAAAITVKLPTPSLPPKFLEKLILFKLPEERLARLALLHFVPDHPAYNFLSALVDHQYTAGSNELDDLAIGDMTSAIIKGLNDPDFDFDRWILIVQLLSPAQAKELLLTIKNIGNQVLVADVNGNVAKPKEVSQRNKPPLKDENVALLKAMVAAGYSKAYDTTDLEKYLTPAEKLRYQLIAVFALPSFDCDLATVIHSVSAVLNTATELTISDLKYLFFDEKETLHDRNKNILKQAIHTLLWLTGQGKAWQAGQRIPALNGSVSSAMSLAQDLCLFMAFDFYREKDLRRMEECWQAALYFEMQKVLSEGATHCVLGADRTLTDEIYGAVIGRIFQVSDEAVVKSNATYQNFIKAIYGNIADDKLGSLPREGSPFRAFHQEALASGLVARFFEEFISRPAVASLPENDPLKITDFMKLRAEYVAPARFQANGADAALVAYKGP